MLTPRQQVILFNFRAGNSYSSQEVTEILSVDSVQTVSQVTVKRDLAQLLRLGFLRATGKGRSVRYLLTASGQVIAPFDAHQYCQIDPDNRQGQATFDFEIFEKLGEIKEFFTEPELSELRMCTQHFVDRAKDISIALHRKELERFIIELSWKSSKIEGNSYTILETERLIRDGVEAFGRTKQEARMILNHKDAFKFVLEQKQAFARGLTLSLIEELHRILVDGLDVDFGLRSKAVGITGTSYRPLDNKFQINEAVLSFIDLINSRSNAFEKSLFAQALVPYIQPFIDGNKRTSRLLSNAILVAHQCSPLSYRSVEEDRYKEAVLTFYERGSLFSLREIFIEQYKFAANNYSMMS